MSTSTHGEHGRSTLIALIVIAVIAVGAYVLLAGSDIQPTPPANNDGSPPANDTPDPRQPGTTTPPDDPDAGNGVETEREFPTKVVYTTDMGSDEEPYRTDCQERGGTFNECGSICSPDADMCAEVCAYTCDDIPTNGTGEGTTTNDENSAATSSPSDPDAQ